MGSFTSLLVRSDATANRVILRRQNERNERQELSFDLQRSSRPTGTRWTPRLFAEYYVRLLNVLAVNGPLYTIKRNVTYYVLAFLNDFMAVGDSIAIGPRSYDHGRNERLLFQLDNDSVAHEDYQGFYRKLTHPDLVAVHDYLTLVHSNLVSEP